MQGFGIDAHTVRSGVHAPLGCTFIAGARQSLTGKIIYPNCPPPAAGFSGFNARGGWQPNPYSVAGAGGRFSRGGKG